MKWVAELQEWAKAKDFYCYKMAIHGVNRFATHDRSAVRLYSKALEIEQWMSSLMALSKI